MSPKRLGFFAGFSPHLGGGRLSHAPPRRVKLGWPMVVWIITIPCPILFSAPRLRKIVLAIVTLLDIDIDFRVWHLSVVRIVGERLS